MKPPTLAAVIPHFNYEQYLPKAIYSVLAQTEPFDEIVVVDDGSTHEAAQAVLDRCAHRVTVLRTANSGQLGACTAAVEATTSEYIYPLDADDFASPNLVARVKPLLADRPAKLQFQVSSVDDAGLPLRSVFPSYPPNYNSVRMRYDNAVLGFYICPPTSGNVFSREALMRLKLHVLNPRSFIDFAAALAMPYLGEVVSINEPLVFYRVHADSHSGAGNAATDIVKRDINAFYAMWDETVAALGLPRPPFLRPPMFIREREMILACNERRVFIARYVSSYLSLVLRSNLRFRQKVILAAWSLALLMPSSSVREELIRMRRSAANRSGKLQHMLYFLLNQRWGLRSQL